jgi:hypothetical protein
MPAIRRVDVSRGGKIPLYQGETVELVAAEPGTFTFTGPVAFTDGVDVFPVGPIVEPKIAKSDVETLYFFKVKLGDRPEDPGEIDIIET